MYGGIGGGIGPIVGGGGALAGTGVGRMGIAILLALGLVVVGALLLRSSSLKHHRSRRR
ncbi:hypothetical protein [Streptomyces sp. L2]|uniref:hypothetical protein n=1 Tax=Streptomyces sp. L2 TaxID=2162665 RepID=UPI0013E8FD08|nr:hypothetical protein [Streptomyces sp. L2]